MSIFDHALYEKANTILDACKKRNVKLATVESCTGGLLSAILTELPGSSDMFTHGFITYANEAKTEMVGVPKDMFAAGGPGAVSEEVARAMAEGALKTASADIAIAITGVAGPGGSEKKPVGLVHFAAAMKGDTPTIHLKMHYPSSWDRSAIRLAAVDTALDMIVEELKK